MEKYEKMIATSEVYNHVKMQLTIEQMILEIMESKESESSIGQRLRVTALQSLEAKLKEDLNG